MRARGTHITVNNVVAKAAAAAAVTATAVCLGWVIASPDSAVTSSHDPAVTCAPAQSTTGREANGLAVIETGLRMQIPTKGIVIGLTAAQQETGLLNLANPAVTASLALPNDGLAPMGHTIGVFMQGPTWGSVTERMTPSVAAEKFFTALNAMPGWQDLPEAEVIQAVQRTATPAAYTAKVTEAQAFFGEHRQTAQRAIACVAAAQRTGATA